MKKFMNRFKRSKIDPSITSHVTGGKALVANTVIGIYDPLIWMTEEEHRPITSKIGNIIHNSLLEDVLTAKNKNVFNLNQLSKAYIDMYNSDIEFARFLTDMNTKHVNGIINIANNNMFNGFVYSEEVYDVFHNLGLLGYDDSSVVFNAVCKTIQEHKFLRLYHDDSKWIKSYDSYMSTITAADQIILLGFDSMDLSMMPNNTVEFDPQKFIFTIGTYDPEIINFATHSTFVSLSGTKTFIFADFSYNDLLRLKRYYDKTKSDNSGSIDQILKFAGSII